MLRSTLFALFCSLALIGCSGSDGDSDGGAAPPPPGADAMVGQPEQGQLVYPDCVDREGEAPCCRYPEGFLDADGKLACPTCEEVEHLLPLPCCEEGQEDFVDGEFVCVGSPYNFDEDDGEGRATESCVVATDYDAERQRATFDRYHQRRLEEDGSVIDFGSRNGLYTSCDKETGRVHSVERGNVYATSQCTLVCDRRSRDGMCQTDEDRPYGYCGADQPLCDDHVCHD